MHARIGSGRAVLAATAAILAVGAFLSGRANLIADSVDYYANLQRLSPRGGKPIVANLHFADQRSPGYTVAALLPHLALVYLAAPLTGTTPGAVRRDAPHAPPGLIPPYPLLLRHVPFHSFAVPDHDTVYEWTIALPLALTSYGFLFAGLAAMASSLRTACPERPRYWLAAAMVAGSPLLLFNIFATPLYATLTAFGASALFCSAFLRAVKAGRARDGFAAGAWLGLVVLTRLDTAVFAATLAVLLWARRERALCLRLAAGAAWAPLAWAAYNWRVFGTPFSFEILRGDINLLRADFPYILKCLVHPASGIAIWSPLVCIGLAALLLARSPGLRSLAVAALPLIALWVVRVPAMLADPSLTEIGGIPVMPPESASGVLGLIRSDMNRYATVLAPPALLGLQDLLARVGGLRNWPRSIRRSPPTPRAAPPGLPGELPQAR